MAFFNNELCKIIVGQKAYASDRSYIQFVTNSLCDFGIVDKYHLPSFKNEAEETTVRGLLQTKDNLNELKDLAYNVKAHRSILDRANDGTIKLAQESISSIKPLFWKMNLGLRSMSWLQKLHSK